MCPGISYNGLWGFRKMIEAFWHAVTIAAPAFCEIQGVVGDLQDFLSGTTVFRKYGDTHGTGNRSQFLIIVCYGVGAEEFNQILCAFPGLRQ